MKKDQSALCEELYPTRPAFDPQDIKDLYDAVLLLERFMESGQRQRDHKSYVFFNSICHLIINFVRAHLGIDMTEEPPPCVPKTVTTVGPISIPVIKTLPLCREVPSVRDLVPTKESGEAKGVSWIITNCLISNKVQASPTINEQDIRTLYDAIGFLQDFMQACDTCGDTLSLSFVNGICNTVMSFTEAQFALSMGEQSPRNDL